MGVWRMWWWGYDDNSERRGVSGNTPCPTLPPPCLTLPPKNSESQTAFVQAHKINFGTGHKHKSYVYARKHRFMLMCINTKLILGSLHCHQNGEFLLAARQFSPPGAANSTILASVWHAQVKPPCHYVAKTMRMRFIIANSIPKGSILQLFWWRNCWTKNKISKGGEFW